MAALALAAAACAPPVERPARIVLVTIDTLRADRVGAYGAQDARTPTLDGLAREGVRFDAAMSPAPLTLPAHTTIFTGLDPDQHGVRHNAVFTVPPGLPTVAERAKENGWATAAFVGAFVLDRRFGLARGFDVYDDAVGGIRTSRAVVGYAERRAGDVVDAFLAWLERAPDRFFAWVHVYDPHAVYDPPAGFSLGFAGRPYDGEIAYVDSQLGRLFAAVDARFGPGGTLVVVTSDHGESLGEHGEPTHSYSLYEATQRVPLIWRGPGFAGGGAVPDVVRLADVGPTLVAAMGGAPLAANGGRDLAPLLRGRGEPVRAYAETIATHYDYGWSALFSARDARWRFVDAPTPELYDLRADPGELRNVAAEHADVARDFAAWLHARRGAARASASGGALSDEDRARLQALGYVVASGGAVRADLSGPDPKQRVAVLAALERAEQLGAQDRWAEAYAQLAAFAESGETFLRIRGSYALNAGLLAEAERDARAGVAASPVGPEALRLLALVRERARDFADARALYAKADALDPKAPEGPTALGRIAEAEGRRDEAERLYRAALARSPSAPEPLWRLAALLLERGDLGAGRALLAEAPDPPDVLVALRVAAAESEAGRPDAAAAHLDRAAVRADLPPLLVAAAGSILEMGGRLDAAVRLYEKALRRAPDAWEIQNALAWALARQRRDLDRALALAQAAAERSKSDPAVLDTLATVELRRGDAKAALRIVDRALPRAPDAVRAHLFFVRAQALEALGSRGAARAALGRALARPADPPPPWTQDAIAFRARIESDTSAASSPP